MGRASFEIRPAKTWQDCLQCEDLQREIWHTPNSTDVVPASLLITAQKNGGLLLGAYQGQKMVGFVFGFLGTELDGENQVLKHCSHMLAVLPEFREHGLGRALKKIQREHLLSQGLELATWTYDPLQAKNARLNIKGLGAIARRYLRNAYGEMVDVLNAGIASDRFEAEWWLNSPRVRYAIERGVGVSSDGSNKAQELYRIVFDERGLPLVDGVEDCAAQVCSMEIPSDLNSLKAQDLSLAQAWRMWTRDSFESAFANGYAVVDVNSWQDERGRKRVAYVLARNWRGE